MLPRMKKNFIPKEPKRKSGWELMNERYNFNIKRAEMNSEGNPTECVLPDIDPFDVQGAMNKYLTESGGVKRTHLDKSGHIIETEKKRYFGVISKKEAMILKQKYLKELGLDENFKFKYEEQEEEANVNGKNDKKHT